MTGTSCACAARAKRQKARKRQRLLKARMQQAAAELGDVAINSEAQSSLPSSQELEGAPSGVADSYADQIFDTTLNRDVTGAFGSNEAARQLSEVLEMQIKAPALAPADPSLDASDNADAVQGAVQEQALEPVQVSEEQASSPVSQEASVEPGSQEAVGVQPEEQSAQLLKASKAAPEASEQSPAASEQQTEAAEQSSKALEQQTEASEQPAQTPEQGQAQPLREDASERPPAESSGSSEDRSMSSPEAQSQPQLQNPLMDRFQRSAEALQRLDAAPAGPVMGFRARRQPEPQPRLLRSRDGRTSLPETLTGTCLLRLLQMRMSVTLMTFNLRHCAWGTASAEELTNAWICFLMGLSLLCASKPCSPAVLHACRWPT